MTKDLTVKEAQEALRAAQEVMGNALTQFNIDTGLRVSGLTYTTTETMSGCVSYSIKVDVKVF